MCGIVGYIGKKNVVDIVHQGLQRLEYRGYDSAGISVLNNGNIWVEKAPGKLVNLEETLDNFPENSTLGIGHTRWATHGPPTQYNAHPHRVDKVAIVHNGIIENYNELKMELLSNGAQFTSETDTEVIAHLLSEELTSTQNVRTALLTVLKRLEGAYALGVITEMEPDALYVVKKNSPLVIGQGNGEENFFASDATAFHGETNEVIFMEDGQCAKITSSDIEVFDFEGNHIPHTTTKLNWAPGTTGKKGYRHYMLKEIHEQPVVLAETINRFVDFNSNQLCGKELALDTIDFSKVDYINIIACGTAYYAGCVAKYFMEPLLGKPVNVELASEFRYREPFLSERTLVISISQSGETADTLACVKYAESKNSPRLSICNTEHSAIPRASDAFIFMNAGQEVGVASTKAFTSQILCLYLWSLGVAQQIGNLSDDELKSILDEVKTLPLHLNTVVNQGESIEKMSRKHYENSDFLYLGRGMAYPIALEGALKLKEISYIHAEGYGAGELKHGPIALVDKHIPIVAIANNDHYYEKTISNVEEVIAREGRVIGIGHPEDTKLKGLSEDYIPCPAIKNQALQAIINTIPVQFLAYYIAVHRGTDVDQPRNLAKSVTVE